MHGGGSATYVFTAFIKVGDEANGSVFIKRGIALKSLEVPVAIAQVHGVKLCEIGQLVNAAHRQVKDHVAGGVDEAGIAVVVRVSIAIGAFKDILGLGAHVDEAVVGRPGIH